MRKFLISSLIFAFFLIGTVLGSIMVFITDLPSIGKLEEFSPLEATKVFSDDGKLIGKFYIQKKGGVKNAL